MQCGVEFHDALFVEDQNALGRSLNFHHFEVVAMLTFRSFSAAIQVDGKDLSEYESEYDEETRTATCWIPSETDQQYSVWWKQHDDMVITSSGRIYLDGSDQKANSWVLHPGEDKRIRGADTSPTSYRPFIFSPLQLQGKSQKCTFFP